MFGIIEHIPQRGKLWFSIISLICMAIAAMCIRHGAFSVFIAILPELTIIIILSTTVCIKFCHTTCNFILLFIPIVMLLLGRSTWLIYNVTFDIPIFSSYLMCSIILLSLFIAVLYQFFRSLLNFNIILWLLYGTTIILYIITLLLGSQIHGATNWIIIYGVNIQLSEISKFLYIISCSVIMQNQKYSENKKLILITGLSAICFILLIIQGELGSILVKIGVYIAFLRFYNGSIKKAVVLLGLLILIGVLLLFIAYSTGNDFIINQMNKVEKRIEIYKDINADPFGSGYQIVQGRKAVAAGNLFGTKNVRYYIPIANSDMIFPAFVQIYGNILGFCVILGIAIYMIMGIYVAKYARDYLDKSIVFGISVCLFTQSLIIIAGSMGIIPLTGITLPFMSQGGSSMLTCFSMAWIMLRINIENTIKQKDKDGKNL